MPYSFYMIDFVAACYSWCAFKTSNNLSINQCIAGGTLVGVAQSFTKHEAGRAVASLKMRSISPLSLAVSSSDRSSRSLDATTWLGVSMFRSAKAPQQPVHVTGWENLRLEVITGLPINATEADCETAASSVGAKGSGFGAIQAGTFEAPLELEGLVLPHDEEAVVGPLTLTFNDPVPLAWSTLTARAYRAHTACLALSGTVHMRLSGFFDGARWFTRHTTKQFQRRPLVVSMVPSLGSSNSSASPLPGTGAFPHAPAGSAPHANISALDVIRPGNWSYLAVGRNSTLACP